MKHLPPIIIGFVEYKRGKPTGKIPYFHKTGPEVIANQPSQYTLSAEKYKINNHV